jgi:hypothetical protein
MLRWWRGCHPRSGSDGSVTLAASTHAAADGVGRYLSFAEREDIALLTVVVCARAVAVLGEDLVQADEA